MGRLQGRKDGDRWLVDPPSVEQEVQRLSRALWWRQVDMPKRKALEFQAAAAKRLVKAAIAWRANPDDPALKAALIEAVDAREALTMRDIGPSAPAQRADETDDS